MNADSERQVTDLVARALKHNEEHELDMTASTETIQGTYARVLRNEGEAGRGLERLREELKDAHERDVQAYAESALAGADAPKRKEVTLRHKIENMEVALEGYEVACKALLEEAIGAVGKGRRKLTGHQGHRLREFIIPRLTEEGMREAWQRGEVERAQEATPRPEDIIQFVTEAYDQVDAQHEANEHARRQKEGYDEAIAAIQRAKGEHSRQGRDMAEFQTDKYVGTEHPWQIDPDLLQYLGNTPGRKALQNQNTGNEVPWPGSVQDLASRSEPSATPA